MLSRRAVIFAATAASVALATAAFATETKTFTAEAFAAAQKSGKPWA